MSLFSKITFTAGLKRKSALMKRKHSRPLLTGRKVTSPDRYSIGQRCCDRSVFQKNVGGSRFVQFNKNGGLTSCDCGDGVSVIRLLPEFFALSYNNGPGWLSLGDVNGNTAATDEVCYDDFLTNVLGCTPNPSSRFSFFEGVLTINGISYTWTLSNRLPVPNAPSVVTQEIINAINAVVPQSSAVNLSIDVATGNIRVERHSSEEVRFSIRKGFEDNTGAICWDNISVYHFKWLADNSMIGDYIVVPTVDPLSPLVDSNGQFVDTSSTLGTI